MPKLLISILFPLLVGGLSALLTMGNMSVYESIIQPALAPPSWLFPVAWTMLYILMGIASYLVYKDCERRSIRQFALKSYYLQLAVNFFWPILFFNMQQFLLSAIWLLLLIALVIIMMVRFYRINKKTLWLLLPYLLWTIFAAYLNWAIYFLNR